MASLPSPQRKTGTGFTNLQRILDANKNNKLASTIGSGVSGTANQARQGLEQGTQDFQTQVGAQKLNTDENTSAYRGMLANPTGAQPGGMAPLPAMSVEGSAPPVIGGKGGAIAAPVSSSIAPDPQRFQKLMAGGYAGPTDLNNSAQLKAQAEEAQALGKNISSPGNKFGLLQRYFGTPTYTRGQQGLDSLLIGKAPELQQARRDTVGLNKLADDKIGFARGLAQDTAVQNQAYGKQVRNDLGLGDQGQISGGALGAVYNPLAEKVAAAVPTGQRYLDELARYKVDRDNQDEYAIVDGQKQGLTYGADPRAFLKENSMAANVNNVASAEDFAKMNALTKLAGIENTYLTDESQAGKYDLNRPTEYNADQYNATVAAKKADYEKEAGLVQAKIDNVIKANSAKGDGLKIGSQYQLAPFQAEMDAIRAKYNLSPIKVGFSGGATADFSNPSGGVGINIPGIESLIPGAGLVPGTGLTPGRKR